MAGSSSARRFPASTGQSWALARGLGSGMGRLNQAGVNTVLREMAKQGLANTPASRAARLARFLAQQLLKRGPLPTHQTAARQKLEQGWAIANEECGGIATGFGEGWVGVGGACENWPFPNGDPQFVDTGYAYVQGWRKVDPTGAWPNWHAKTRSYERLTGTRSWRNPRDMNVPAPGVRYPSKIDTVPGVPLSPRPQPLRAPQIEPWAPSWAPLERPIHTTPLETPWPMIPDHPVVSPEGDPIRGPAPATAPQPARAPRPGQALKPWELPVTRTIARPELAVRQRLAMHIKMPPFKGTREIKPQLYPRLALAVARQLGRATEGCDFIDTAFNALPLAIQQQYDSTKFTRGRPLETATSDFGWGQGARNKAIGDSGYAARRQYSGRTFQQKRKAFNDKQAQLPNWAKANWGRKSCAARAKAVYDHLDSLDQKAFIANILKENIQDIAWGIAGEGAASNAKQTGRSTGWISRIGG